MSTVMTGTTSLYELAKTFWRTDLKAAGKSEKTIRNYLDAARQLDAFCRSNGMPVDPAVIRREHIAAFLADLRERTSASTEATRFRGLQQLFRWLHDDMGEIESNPMARMKPPKVEDRPVPIVSADDLRALFATCKGKTFENLRDAALMRMLLNTGPRIEEIMRLKLDDVDPASGRITVVGKGARIRYLYPTPIAMKRVEPLPPRAPSSSSRRLV